MEVNFQFGRPSVSLLRKWCLGLLLMGSVLGAQEAPQINLPRVTLSAGMYRIDAQVASTNPQRNKGLMYQTYMPANEGMLFAFEEAGVQCFWMKNTLLPLSAAFIADDGTIVTLADMKPQTTNAHCSSKPVRFVLEMNQGWFAKHKIDVGYKLIGPPWNQAKP